MGFLIFGMGLCLFAFLILNGEKIRELEFKDLFLVVTSIMQMILVCAGLWVALRTVEATANPYLLAQKEAARAKIKDFKDSGYEKTVSSVGSVLEYMTNRKAHHDEWSNSAAYEAAFAQVRQLDTEVNWEEAKVRLRDLEACRNIGTCNASMIDAYLCYITFTGYIAQTRDILRSPPEEIDPEIIMFAGYEFGRLGSDSCETSKIIGGMVQEIFLALADKFSTPTNPDAAPS